MTAEGNRGFEELAELDCDMRRTRWTTAAPALITSERFWPSRYSIAMKKYLSCVPCSKTVGTYRLSRQNASCSLRSEALGFDNLPPVVVVFDRDELQRDLPVRPRVGGEEHGGHAPAPDLVQDFVRADAVEDGGHRHPQRPPGRGRTGRIALPSMNQLSRASLARASLDPANTSGLMPRKTLAMKVAALFSSTTTRFEPFAEPLRMNTLCGDRGVRPGTKDQRGARIVVNIAADEPDPRRRADLDGGPCGAGDFDARHRHFGIHRRDAGAERCRGVADHPESFDRRVRHVVRLNRGIDFGRRCPAAG